MTQCRACLIFCSDFRLREQLASFISDHRLDTEGVDVIRLCGATRILARPNEPRYRDFLLEQIAVSHDLHHIREIHLVNHEDCGAYGEEDIPDGDQELACHIRDLWAARDLLRASFPDAEIFLYFMRLSGRVDLID